jgi:hypothetical protein
MNINYIGSADERREKEGLHFAHITFHIIPSAFSDNDNDNGDDSPPINLFIGKFNFPGANESDDAGGWANFDDAEFPSPVVALSRWRDL